MDQTNLLLLILLMMAVLGKNISVSIAVGFLFFVRLFNLDRMLPVLESYAIQAGIVILTIGVLSPLASGRIGTGEITASLKSPASIAGIVVGILVSYLGGRGVPLLNQQPLVVTGILIGTIVGVAFFKGVPVGPLIAAGGVGVMLQLFQSR